MGKTGISKKKVRKKSKCKVGRMREKHEERKERKRGGEDNGEKES